MRMPISEKILKMVDDGNIVYEGDRETLDSMLWSTEYYAEISGSVMNIVRRQINTAAEEREKYGKLKKQSINGCSKKYCRLGKTECDKYWGCRDKCREAGKRITSMDKCPEESL